MDTYSIEANAENGFRVRVTDAEHNWTFVTGFATESEAQKWVDLEIEAVIRSTNASDVP